MSCANCHGNGFILCDVLETCYGTTWSATAPGWKPGKFGSMVYRVAIGGEYLTANRHAHKCPACTVSREAAKDAQ